MTVLRPAVLLLTCALVAACKAPTAETPKKAASAKPEVAAVTPPPAPPTASGALRKPGAAVREIAGSVALDAGYALQHGGQIIASNGASALQLGEASLIAHNGSNLILPNGGRIISENGGGIISENGGGIISENGGGLISDNGSNLTGKVKWGLLEAAPAEAAFGSVLKAAGLAVGVVDLASGKLLKLGEDDHGNPAYGVVTDADGAFHVYLPAELTTAVRVVGLARDGADLRLQTNLVASDLDGNLTLDEDSQQIANNLRLQLAKGVLHMFDPPAGETAVDEIAIQQVDQATLDAYKAAQQRLAAAFKAAGGAGLPAGKKVAIALRLADMELAHMKLEELRSAATQPVPIKGAQRPATPGLVLEDITGVLHQLRERVGTIMEAERQAGRDPEAYFAAKPYLKDADPQWPIRKPADFDDFIIRGILANPASNSLAAGLEFATVLSDPDYDIGATALDTFLRANIGLYAGTIDASFAPGGQLLPQMEAELTRLVKAGTGSAPTP
jgi:hypothetical protein